MSGFEYINEEGETAVSYTRKEDNTSTESNRSQAVDDTDPPPPYECIFSVSSPHSNEEDKVERIGPKMADEKVNKNFTAKCEDLASDVGHRIETCAMKVNHGILIRMT